MSSNFTSDLGFYCLLGIVVGIIVFYNGFRNLKLKRLIENIPTSKIRSLSMGFAEVYGKAIKTFEMFAPFSNSECVFFQYLIEEYRGSGKHSRWETIKRYASPYSFEIDDGTGSISVCPQGAEVDISTKNIYTNTFFKGLPDQAKDFLEMNQIKYKNFLGFKRTMRLTEYYIPPGVSVYVLGDARHPGKALKDFPEYSKKAQKKKNMMIDTLIKIKKNPRLMKKYDLNNDGIIDDTEWEKARDDVTRWLDHNFDKELIKKKNEDIKVEIGKGDTNKTFFISDKSQKKLSQEMVWKSSGFVFGGAALTIICASVLIIKFI